MTLLVAPYGSPAVRGKTGSSVYFMRQGRQFVKPRTYHNPDPTPPQTLARQRADTLHGYWLQATDNARRQWAQEAPPPLSGWNYFCHVNFPRLAAAWVPLYWPPDIGITRVIDYLQVTAPGITLDIEWNLTPTPGAGAAMADIWTHGPRPLSRAPDLHYRKRFGIYDASDGVAFLAGDVSLRWTIWIRFIFLDGSRTTSWRLLEYIP